MRNAKRLVAVAFIVLAFLAGFAAIVIGGAVAGDKAMRPDGGMDQPIPPGQRIPTLPDRIGYTIYLYERTAAGTAPVALPIEVKYHDMRRRSGRLESDRQREYLDSIRNAITVAGHHAGKSEAWIQNARDQIAPASLTSLSSLRSEALCQSPYMQPEQISVECGSIGGGGGGGGGGGCGTIVCASTIKKNGAIVGCGNGCGDCSIVTVCG